MSKRNNFLLLTDIIDSINYIEEYLKPLDEKDFYNDRKTKDAVVRNLEIIGEAANQITIDFKNKYPAVEWREAADLRNKIIHDYSGLDYVLLWEIITLNLPSFKHKVIMLLDNKDEF
ncbi:MAG: DUF86 domain-containing protein [Ginsengibacter sp.]